MKVNLLKRLSLVTIISSLFFAIVGCGKENPTEPGESPAIPTKISFSASGVTVESAGTDTRSRALDSEAVFTVELTNKNPDTLYFTFEKSAITPASDSWTTSVCTGERCYPPTVEKLDVDIPIAPNGEMECTLHFFGFAAGTYKAKFKLYKTSDPTKAYEHEFTVTYK